MSNQQFIGRSEVLVSKILWQLLKPMQIIPQYPIKQIMNNTDYASLNEILQKHKFDFMVERLNHPNLIVEVNYKHGNTAAKKWETHFMPIIKSAGMIPVAINDYNCRHLFTNTDSKHKLNWDDYRDVIDSLEMAGVKP